MNRRIKLWKHPTRIFQVYDAQRRSVGSWSTRGYADALSMLERHPRGQMLVCDEYQGRGMQYLGWFERVVVDVVPGALLRN